MKKLIIIGLGVVMLFGGVFLLTKQETKVKTESDANPYGDKELHPATVDLIGDKNYNSITMPDEVDKKIESSEPTFVYFYSPTCGYCMEMTPVLMQIAKSTNTPILQYNLLEYGDKAEKYSVEGTPTLIYFEDGEEVRRLVGYQPDKEIVKQFLIEGEKEGNSN